MIEHAYNAILKGFSVFPVDPGGKVPARWQNYGIKWSEWATTSPQRIADYWHQWPEANVGIACKNSGLLVVDCDIKDDVHGVNTFFDICYRYGVSGAFDTYTVVTGSGGLHFYYSWPQEVQASQSGLAASVDIRSNGGTHGGYVLGAGSRTEKGPYFVDNDSPVAPCPPPLVELCRNKPRERRHRGAFSQPGNAHFEGLLEAVRNAAEGNRNHTLHWAACAMALDGADIQRAEELLTEAARVAGLSEAEVAPTVRSAYRQMSRSA